jgi:hypothetical protein
MRERIHRYYKILLISFLFFVKQIFQKINIYK